MFSKGRVENFVDRFVGRPFFAFPSSLIMIYETVLPKKIAPQSNFKKKAQNDVLRTLKKI